MNVSLKIPVKSLRPGGIQTIEVRGTSYTHTIDEEEFQFVILNIEDNKINLTHYASGLQVPVNLLALKCSFNFTLSTEQAANLAIQACIMNQGEKKLADRMRNAKVLNIVGTTA